MQRSRFPMWTATLSIVALGPLALSLSACSKEEPKTEPGGNVTAHADGAETPPAESPSSPDVTTSSESESSSTEAAAKPEAGEGEAHEAGEKAAGEAAHEKEGAEKEVPPKESGEQESGEKSEHEAAAKGAEEKPAAEESHGDEKKPAKKKGDKKEEAPAKEAKPKFADLAVQVTKAGKGTAATEGSTVTLHYKASVVDAEKPFDSTYATRRPIEVQLGEGAKLAVIEGLRRGLEGLTPGTEARLEIPASLAWGEKGNPAVGVPANADVVFEISVLDVR